MTIFPDNLAGRTVETVLVFCAALGIALAILAVWKAARGPAPATFIERWAPPPAPDPIEAAAFRRQWLTNIKGRNR